MKTLLLALAVTMSPAAAWAGCFSYYEHDLAAIPMVELCAKDQCVTAGTLKSCGNVHGGYTIYDNGWSTHFSVERDSTVIVSSDGTIIPEDEFSCRRVDGEYGCGGD